MQMGVNSAIRQCLGGAQRSCSGQGLGDYRKARARETASSLLILSFFFFFSKLLGSENLLCRAMDIPQCFIATMVSAFHSQII